MQDIIRGSAQTLRALVGCVGVITFTAAGHSGQARPQEAAELRFNNTTDQSGLLIPLVGMYGHAAAAGDVNTDGWVDLFVGTFADRPTNVYQTRGAEGPSPDLLLLGGPEGFIPDPSFPEMYGRTSGATFADLDGDDDLDLVLARNYRPRAPAATVVLRNDIDAWTSITLLETTGARSVAVLDYDGDGRLDLFVTEDRWSGGSSVLMRNEGDLRFTDATSAAGIPGDVHGLGVAAADLTGDGRPDLFVSGSNRLFVNNGGHFAEVFSSTFEWDIYGREDDIAGVAVADLNRDGLPDLVIGQHYNSTLDFGRKVPVRVVLNDGLDDQGSPRFLDVTEESGIPGLPTKAPHVEIADLDNDGWPDIVTGASAAEGQLPAIFRHLGLDTGAPRFAVPAGLGAPQYWVVGSVFDADRDGGLDLFMVEWNPELPSLMWRNESARGHWLDIEIGLAGSDGIGTVIEIYRAGHAGEASALLGRREIMANTGYGGGALLRAHFGLGTETSVDLLVRYPWSDEIDDVEVLQVVEVNRLLCLGECSQ